MRKLIFSALAVILALGLMGGTFAYFQETQTSTSNTFTAGTLLMEISDDGTWDPDGWGTIVDRTWEMTNMVPGISEVTNHASIQEIGTLDGDHVEIVFSATIVPGTLLPQDMAEWLEVTAMTYGSTSLFNDVKATTGWDVNSNGFLDLDDLMRSGPVIASGGPLDDLTAPHTVGFISLSMTIRFNEGATDDVQGATLTMVVSFILNQHSSQ